MIKMFPTYLSLFLAALKAIHFMLKKVPTLTFKIPNNAIGIKLEKCAPFP